MLCSSVVCATAALIGVAVSVGVLPGAVYMIIPPLASLGVAPLFLLWFELYSRLTYPMLVFHLAVAQGASSLLVALFSLPMLGWSVPVACLLFPVFCVLCYFGSSHWLSQQSLPKGEKIAEDWSFPIRPVLVIGLFTFANSMVHSNMTANSGYAALGVTFSMAVIACVSYRKHGRFDTSSPFRFSFPLITLGLLCVIVCDADVLPWNEALATVGALSTSAGSGMFHFCVYVLLCTLSYRYGVNPVWLFGLSLTAGVVGKIAARLLGFLDTAFTGDVLVNCLVIFMVSILYATLSHGDSGRFWVISRDCTQRDEAEMLARGSQEFDRNRLPASTDLVVDACARAARTYGLTRREEEILFELAQDQGAANIAGRLCLAESTVKTFIKHIYAKMGVHGRPEVISLVHEFL